MTAVECPHGLAIPGFSGYRLFREDGGWRILGKRGWVLKPGAGTFDGRPQYCIIRDDGRKTTQGLGRLVLLATVGPPPTPEHQCCHADGDPFNNDPSNLRWGTRSENMGDAFRHGTHNLLRRPLGGGSRSLTPEQVAIVVADYVPHSSGGQPHSASRVGSKKELAERFGVSRNVIDYILEGS